MRACGRGTGLKQNSSHKKNGRPLIRECRIGFWHHSNYSPMRMHDEVPYIDLKGPRLNVVACGCSSHSRAVTKESLDLDSEYTWKNAWSSRIQKVEVAHPASPKSRQRGGTTWVTIALITVSPDKRKHISATVTEQRTFTFGVSTRLYSVDHLGWRDLKRHCEIGEYASIHE